jgi:hypothetical protein
MTLLPPDVCMLIADWGIGDHYIVGGFADAVRQHHGTKVWMSGRKNLAFVAALYPAIERYVEWPAGVDPKSVDTWEVEGGKPFYAHFPKLELMRAVGYNGFHFLDAYRCRLGLPAAALLTPPGHPNAGELVAASALLKAEGFPTGRTVVLSIEARTTPTDGIDAAFWMTLAGELQAQGFAILVNAAPTTAVPPGLRSIALPLAAFRPIVQSAGFFCSVRSGLSDLACDLRCPQVVLYPPVRYWAGTLAEGTTFARFGLKKTPHEIVFSPTEAGDQARSVAAFFSACVLQRPAAALAPCPAPLAG